MKNQHSPRTQSQHIKRLVITALLFALSIVLSYIEGMIPPLFVAVPGIKLGLSNIIVMYTLFLVNWKQAYVIAVLKGLFVFLLKSPVSGIISVSGGIVSVTIMLLLLLLSKRKLSYLLLSVFGAVFHNIGQLTAASLINSSIYIWVYFPVLLVAGILAGVITSVILKFILPALKRLD